MGEEIVNYVMNENAIFLKEECLDSYSLDDKTQVFQTAVDMNNTNDPFKLEVDTKGNTIRESKISLVNIEIEQPLYDINQIVTVDIKTEFDNKYLFCSHCQAYYQDYCTRCQMLVCILDRNFLNNTNQKVVQDIPMGFLEMRKLYGYVGIFTLKIIPVGVQFGPVIGLTTLAHSWRIKDGKFLVGNEQSKSLHWMWYINSARNTSEQNLLVFQCDGNLYYRCIREIQQDEELLVYFGEEYIDSLNKDVERNFSPITEENVKNIFACTFCYLGFSLEIHLRKHKTNCPKRIVVGESPVNDIEITQCLICKIYLERRECLEYHKSFCYEKYMRPCLLPVSNGEIVEVKNDLLFINKGKRHKRETYKCLHCKYLTAYKSDLISHANKHYPVKIYSCEICHKRFKRHETLKKHLMKVHNYNDNMEVQSHLKHQYKCSKCEYETHLQSRLRIHHYIHETVKRFQCSECPYETNFKCHLNKHVNGKHRHIKKYNCLKCEFETFYPSNLRKHLDTHVEVKRFKCSECSFITNNTPNLNRHINRKHREAKRYKCLNCEFETSYQSNLRHHMFKHEGIKRLKCSDCDYETNRKRNLRAHINSKHSDIKAYKCQKCKFETSHGSSFKKHLDTHEERKGGLKCLQCDYETNNKTYLRVHMKTKHCEIKKYKCSKCDYESAYDGSFRKHLYTHEEEKRLKCSLCDFKTNYNWHLKRHIDKKHSEENI